MANFVLLGLALVSGILLRLSRRLPAEAPAVLNGLIICVCLPAFTFVQLQQPGEPLSRGLLFPVLAPWILFGLALVVLVPLGRVLKWRRSTLGAVLLTAGLGNTCFLGFPLLEAIYGPGSLRTAVLVDQLGSFLALSTAGLAVAALCAEGKSRSGASVAKRIFGFPPLLALAAGIAFRGASIPSALVTALDRLGSPLVPLALVSVGYQLASARSALFTGRDAGNGREAGMRSALVAGLGFKLLLGPALTAALLAGLLGARGQEIQIGLLETAMAPMVTGAIVAEEFGLDATVANAMLTIGIPLSLVLIPVWARVLAGL